MFRRVHHAPACRPMPPASCLARGPRDAFTLIELLAVMAVIAIFVGVIGFAFRGGGSETVGLQSAQSSIVGLLTLARGEAAVRGRDAAMLVSAGPTSETWSASTPLELRERYLRFVVVAVRNDQGTAWLPINEGIFLPKEVFVIPGGTGSPRRFPSSLKETGVNWFRYNSSGNPTSSGHDVDSSVLQEEAVVVEDISISGERWVAVIFSPRGTISPAGDVALAIGRPQLSPTAPPVVLVNPDTVRGVAVSRSGPVTTINSRADF